MIFKEFSGLIPYKESEQGMKNLISQPDFQDQTWFLEHPPLYTFGTSAKESDFLSKTSDFEIHKTGRGGQITYHGPGQLMGYVMKDLKTWKQGPDIKKYIEALENWIIKTLDHFGLKGIIRPGRVGVWVVNPKTRQEKKIAAIGVRVSKWRTYHGFCLNIDSDLKAYNHIVPCGISNFGTTSLKEEGINTPRHEVTKTLKELCPFY